MEISGSAHGPGAIVLIVCDVAVLHNVGARQLRRDAQSSYKFQNNACCISKNAIINSVSAQYLCFIYQNNPLRMDNCITTIMHVFYRANYNKIQIKCIFYAKTACHA